MKPERGALTALFVILSTEKAVSFSARPKQATQQTTQTQGDDNREGKKNRPLIPELEELAASNSKRASERLPWDAVRFVQQSSKFITLPNPFARSQPKRKIQPGEKIWSAGSPNNPFTFASLDDVVMGGASSSTFDNSSGMWSGTVTTANNGGFVGTRSTPFTQGALDMSSCRGIEIKVRGGAGRRFKGTVRDSTDFNGVCWTSSFDTMKGANAVQTIRLSFDKLIPTIFAKALSGQVLKKDNILGIQFAYSKFEFDGDLNPNFALGDFSVQILEISGW